MESHYMTIREAQRHPSFDPLLWLKFARKDLVIYILLCHGIKLDKQVQIITELHI